MRTVLLVVVVGLLGVASLVGGEPLPTQPQEVVLQKKVVEGDAVLLRGTPCYVVRRAAQGTKVHLTCEYGVTPQGIARHVQVVVEADDVLAVGYEGGAGV
jgi:hypothetical protein